MAYVSNLITIITMIHLTQQFYTQLIPQQQHKCYLVTTFPKQNVLVHLRLPLITDKVKIEVESFVGDNKIFGKEIKKADDKITIRIDEKLADVNEVQVCIKTTIHEESPAQKELIRNKRYLIWLSISPNFIKHIENSYIRNFSNEQDQQVPEESTQRLLISLKSKIQSMNATYEQQLNRYYINEQRQVKNDGYLNSLVNTAYLITVVETGIIFFCVFLYAGVFYQYL